MVVEMAIVNGVVMESGAYFCFDGGSTFGSRYYVADYLGAQPVDVENCSGILSPRFPVPKLGRDSVLITVAA